MDAQSEVLEYLQAHGASFDVLFELLCRTLTKARTNVAEIDIREKYHTIGVRTVLDYGQSTSQGVARTPAQIDDQPDIELVHRPHHSFILLGGDRRRMMAVDVDHRKLGARYRM